MNIAVVTFDGFNEIDSIVAAHILNRVAGWRAEITGPSETLTSMNGVVVRAPQPLEIANAADAVIVGSGRRTREMVANDAMMARLQLDPRRQWIASQCSGALVLARLGLLTDAPVCTDRKTQPWLEAAGYRVLDTPFHASGRVATAGGCLSAHYLAAWLIWAAAGRDAAVDALSYVLPHGEEEEYTRRALAHVAPFVAAASASNGDAKGVHLAADGRLDVDRVIVNRA
jgi:transcriptional regulator GlxA family with amidase domain